MLNRRLITVALSVTIVTVLSVALVSSCGNDRSTAKSKVYPVAGLVVEAPPHFDTWTRDCDCWIPGTPGAAVLYGDSVRNSTGGGLVLALPGGGMLRAGERAEFELTKTGLEPPVVRVVRGDVWLEAAGGVRLRTASATVIPVSSRGEEATCRVGVGLASGGPTTVTCYAGSATVEAAGETVTLQEGTASVCGQGGPPSPASESTGEAPAGGLAFLVDLQTAPFFRNEATRARAEDDARSKLTVDPNNAWSNVTLGRALLDAGKTQEAKDSFNRAIESRKGFAQALAGLGRAALFEGRWKEAAREYDQARLADKKSIEALLGAAAAAFGMGDLPEAGKWFKEALDIDPQSQNALAGLGAASILSGDLVKASDDIEKALDIEPALAEALVLRSYIATLKGDLASSLADLRKAADADPEDYGIMASIADRTLRMAMGEKATAAFKRLNQSRDPAMMSAGYQGMGAVAWRSGDSEEALTDWTKAQDLAPDRPAVLQDLGIVEMRIGETEQAIAAFTRATTIEIADWRAHEMLAGALLAAGSNSAALTEARAAVELAPDRWTAHIMLGLALYRCGEKDESTMEMGRGLSLKPASGLSAAHHALVAEALRIQGKPAEALREYRAAQKVNPSEGAYYRLAGDVLEELGRSAEALTQYRKAVKAAPSDSLSRIELARALYGSGKKDDAIKVLRDSVERDPNDALPRQLLGEFLLADDDVEGAMFQLDAAVSTSGIGPATLASVLVTRGNAFDRNEDFAAAMADYSRAISCDPGRGDAWFYLAGDLERTGRPAEARNAYASAAALCGDTPEWKKFYEESSDKLRQLR